MNGPKKINAAPPPPPTFDDADAGLLKLKPAPAESVVMTKSDPVINDNGYADYLRDIQPDASGRNRVQFKFWLNLRAVDDYRLFFWLEPLKEQRSLTCIIRDALRLFQDLGQGNIGVLLELFPSVEDAFYKRFTAQKVAPDSSISDQLARLEAMLLQAGNTPVTSASSGPKALNVPTVAGPVYADEDDNLVIRKAKSDGKSAQNFLESAFAVAGY